MRLSGDIGVWIAALFSIGGYSFLASENRVSRFIEFLFIGLGAGSGSSKTQDLPCSSHDVIGIERLGNVQVRAGLTAHPFIRLLPLSSQRGR